MFDSEDENYQSHDPMFSDLKLIIMHKFPREMQLDFIAKHTHTHLKFGLKRIVFNDVEKIIVRWL